MCHTHCPQQRPVTANGVDLLTEIYVIKCNLTLAMSPIFNSNNTITICWHKFFLECSLGGLEICQKSLSFLAIILSEIWIFVQCDFLFKNYHKWVNTFWDFLYFSEFLSSVTDRQKAMHMSPCAICTGGVNKSRHTPRILANFNMCLLTPQKNALLWSVLVLGWVQWYSNFGSLDHRHTLSYNQSSVYSS